MKKTKLKILFTSLSFFALTATFGQVDTTQNVTPGDSANVSVPEASPMTTDSTVTTDSTSVNQSSSTNQAMNTESASVGYDKAEKKRLKAEKKEAKAEKKEGKAEETEGK